MPEALLRMYDEERSMVRHHEEQRATITNLLMTLDLAIVGAAGFLAQQMGVVLTTLSPATGAFATLLLVSGLFGAAVCRKHYERMRYHSTRGKDVLRELDARHQMTIVSTLSRSREHHAGEYPLFHRIRLHTLWEIVHVGVLCVGLVWWGILLV